MRLLGGHVLGGPHHLRKLRKCQPPRSGLAGNAEINQFDVILGIHHDVFRLQVAVHDPVSVNVVEGVEDAEGDLYGAFRG